ncbi:ABC transporter substrate-binding protein [Streptomyces wuyuanensis]|uniref:ABC transporter substrate-binding protein n=1 Tax=Streptomyces wuyuanensis TaxID=1196353 RepID=UPI003417436D
MRRIISAGFAIGVLASVSACGATGSSSQPDSADTSGAPTSTTVKALPAKAGSVTIGSAAFPEAELLAHLYAGAMKANGVKADVHANIGERTAYMAALKDGSIGAVPEYSGALLNYLSPGNTARSSEDVYAELQQTARNQNLAVVNYAPAQDADTITVTRKTADKYHLTTIGDLKPVANRLRLGAPAPMRTESYGVPALKKVYGVVFKQFVSLSPSGTVIQTALRNGTVDAANIFSTDPAISRFDLVSLKDPQHIFAAQNIVPVFKQDVLTQPMADACDAVSAKLDTDTLRTLVAEVVDGGDPSTVASNWLKQNDLAKTLN